MLTAARIAAVVAALTLGTTFLAVQVRDLPEPAAPAAAPSENWTTVTGTQEFTCGYGSCEGVNSMSDPRLDGEFAITWSSRERSSSDTSNFLLWGQVDATTDDGSWAGQWVGFVDQDELHHTMVWLQGSDGYEGLSYVEQGTQSTPDGPLSLTGLIYEGDIPPTVLSGLASVPEGK